MKKRNTLFVLPVMLLSLFTLDGHCQTNDNHLLVGGGLSYARGVDVSIAYEHGVKYHNAWEYFASYHVQYADDPEAGHITKDSFWNSYNSWHAGIAYKPCVQRGRNHHGNLRIGVSGGSDLHRFVGGVHVGYEHSFALRSGWELFFQVKSDVIMPRSGDLFRTGALFGMKVPM